MYGVLELPEEDSVATARGFCHSLWQILTVGFSHKLRGFLVAQFTRRLCELLRVRFSNNLLEIPISQFCNSLLQNLSLVCPRKIEASHKPDVSQMNRWGQILISD